MLARESRSDLHADEIVDIADNDPDPHRARNRIDARKWLASKMNAKQYGERLDVNVQGTIDLAGIVNAARQRLSGTVQVIESIDDSPALLTDTASVDIFS